MRNATPSVLAAAAALFTFTGLTTRAQAEGVSAESGFASPSLYLQVGVGDDVDGEWNDNTDDWHVKTRPSIWFFALDGEVDGMIAGNPVDADFERDYDEITDNLDIALGIDVEAGKGPWTLGVMGQWMSWEDDDATTIGGFDAETEIDFVFVEPAIYYRLLEVPLNDQGDMYPRMTLEAFGGARFTTVDVNTDIETGPFAGAVIDFDEELIDGLGGLRGRFDLSEKWNVSLSASAGAGDSDSIWTAIALVEYRFNPKWGAFIGYKALNWNTEENDVELDVTFDGPVLGLSVRW